MEKRIELSIIIVDFKSENYVLKLVPNIFEFLKNVNFEIIIVDNNPKSENAELFRKSFSDKKNVAIIKAEKNLGYGAGNNLGAKSAQGEYLLLLNPDTEIVDDSIEKMLDFLAKHSEIGSVSPLIYQADGENLQRHFYANFQNLAGITLKRWQGKESLSFQRRRESTNSSFFLVEMITGAAMMLKRNTFEKVGGFDENYFMYFEDDDLCREISKLGLKNAVLTTAKIIHFEGKSSTSKQKKEFYYQSQNYYWQKWNGPFLTILMKILRSPYILWQKIKS